MQLKLRKTNSTFTVIGTQKQASLVSRLIRRLKKRKSKKTSEIERLHYEMDKQSKLIAQLNRQVSDLQSDRRIANKELYKLAAPKKVKTSAVRQCTSQWDLQVNCTRANTSSISELLWKINLL